MEAMKRAWLAAAAVATQFTLPLPAAEPPREVISIDYARDKGLVAAAYQGGQVVVWESASGRVRNVFHPAGPHPTLNKPLAQFSPDGRRLAFTAEGDGLVVYDLEAGTSTVAVPRRLLYRGITSFHWSHQQDAILAAIGRDIALVSPAGRIQWQRRLETKSLITDVVWHPSERLYTVATDDTVVSSYETVSGQVTATAMIETVAHATEVKLGWSKDGSAIVAVLKGKDLALLDPDTLKPAKLLPCSCSGFDWSPSGKEIAAAAPPNIAVFTASGQRAREIHIAFDGSSPVLWADDAHLLTAFTDSSIVLRDARSPKVIRTFALPSAPER